MSCDDKKGALLRLKQEIIESLNEDIVNMITNDCNGLSSGTPISSNVDDYIIEKNNSLSVNMSLKIKFPADSPYIDELISMF